MRRLTNRRRVSRRGSSKKVDAFMGAMQDLANEGDGILSDFYAASLYRR